MKQSEWLNFNCSWSVDHLENHQINNDPPTPILPMTYIRSITLWYIHNGKINYKWQFSIAFCMFTRPGRSITTTPGISPHPHPVFIPGVCGRSGKPMVTQSLVVSAVRPRSSRGCIRGTSSMEVFAMATSTRRWSSLSLYSYPGSVGKCN